MSNFEYFILGFVFSLGLILIFLTYFLIRRLLHKKTLNLSLNYSLLLVEIPKYIISAESTDPRIKVIEELTKFENFLGTLSKLKNPIIFEIATPHFGEEIFFYLAVPQKEISFFQKTIKGFWPGAEVSIIKQDYNIFNPEGSSLASIVTLKKNNYLPIKTYTSLSLSNLDSLDSFLSAFSRINKEGEGLAYQLILLPVSSSENKKIFKKIQSLREGKKLEDVLEKKILTEISKEIGKALSEKTKEEEEKEKAKPKPLEENAIKNLELKANKPLFRVNIRLVVSTNDPHSADLILSSLEAAFHQFVNPGFNEFSVTRYKKAKLKKIFYQFSFRIFDKSHSSLLNSEEITSIFHFPTSYTKNEKIRYLKSKTSAPPPNLPTEGVILGKNVYQGIEAIVRITRNDRRRHIYTIGQTGTGKTTLLKTISGLLKPKEGY